MIDDGGHIYPYPNKAGHKVDGITRRDLSADRIASSMSCLLRDCYDQNEDDVIEMLVRRSYKLADAMIVEGSKK